jgi:hypothetical protein
VIAEGGEVYPADFFNFLKSGYLISGALVISISVFIYKYINDRFGKDKEVIVEDKSTSKPLVGALFFLTISFFMGTVILSFRFQDYFVFLAGLFVAISFSEIGRTLKFEDKIISKGLKTGVMIFVVYLFTSNALFLQEKFGNGAPVDAFKQTGEWLNKNVPEKTVLFNTSWNWFSQMYYYAPNYYYIAGLGPRFLSAYNIDLYWEWIHISNDGYVCKLETCDDMQKKSKVALSKDDTKKTWFKNEGDKIANTLEKDFQTSYVVSVSTHKNLNDVMDGNSRFEKLFTADNGIVIYHIKK